ncbi:hypothetical protein [Aminipila terrae]|uniref:hypothetical protein n=1 Tax=Aminipila terrae TaxID=2697030 RepID=UPI002FE6F81F
MPVKTEQRKGWGENSGYRKEIDIRNRKIIKAYSEGVPMEEIANFYCLSVYAIRKIIYQK